jgi:hypothetical protein
MYNSSYILKVSWYDSKCNIWWKNKQVFVFLHRILLFPKGIKKKKNSKNLVKEKKVY